MIERRLYKAIGYSGAYVGAGLATMVLGPTLTSLAEQTGSQLSEISLLFTTMALGYLLGSLGGGRLYDRTAGHPVMVVCLVVMAAMLALVPVISNLWLLALAIGLLGIAGGAVDVGGNTLLVWVYGREVGPYMNALHFFFGLGSMLSPLIIGLTISLSGGIAAAYWTLALLIVPAVVWLLRVPSPVSPSNAKNRSAERSQTRVQSLLLLLVLLFFLYVGAEASFGGWISPYAVARGLSDQATAAYLASAFWGALTVGRLLAIPIAARVRPRTILLVDLLGCLVSMGVLLVGAGFLPATWLGTLGLGLSMASFFPTLISLAGRRMTITGQITGWFLAGSSVGGMTLPWLIGQLFEPVGPQAAMWVIALDLVVALSAFAVLMLYSARETGTVTDAR